MASPRKKKKTDTTLVSAAPQTPQLVALQAAGFSNADLVAFGVEQLREKVQARLAQLRAEWASYHEALLKQTKTAWDEFEAIALQEVQPHLDLVREVGKSAGLDPSRWDIRNNGGPVTACSADYVTFSSRFAEEEDDEDPLHEAESPEAIQQFAMERAGGYWVEFTDLTGKCRDWGRHYYYRTDGSDRRERRLELSLQVMSLPSQFSQVLSEAVGAARSADREKVLRDALNRHPLRLWIGVENKLPDSPDAPASWGGFLVPVTGPTFDWWLRVGEERLALLAECAKRCAEGSRIRPYLTEKKLAQLCRRVAAKQVQRALAGFGLLDSENQLLLDVKL